MVKHNKNGIDDKKTLLIISPNFLEPTAWMISAYKTALNIAKYTDVKVVVLTSQTKGSKKYEMIDDVIVHRTKAYYIPDPFNYTFTPFIFNDLGKIIKKYRPDYFLVNKYMFFPSLTGIYLRAIGKRYILQTDAFPGIDWFGPSRMLNLFMWIYSRTLGMIVLKLARKTIILHEGLEKTAKKLGLRYKIVHNGVDIDKFNVEPSQDILKLKGNKKLITYVGRLDKVKGFEFVLEASKRVDAKFLFVCGNKYPEKRKRLAKEYPNITFLGFRKDIPAIFKASDIHVLASYMEGLPNSILEAMAAGCAVVATPVGAIPYFIKHKVNGYIANQNGISRALNKLLEDEKLRKKIIKNARNTIENDFNWKKIARSLIDEIREIY